VRRRSIEVVVADLGDKAGVKRVEEILPPMPAYAAGQHAGIGGASQLLESDVDKMEAMIDLNVTRSPG